MEKKGSVLYIYSFLSFLDDFFVKEEVQIGPCAHFEPLGGPFQAHRRFLPEPTRNLHFHWVPFALFGKPLFAPARFHSCR